MCTLKLCTYYQFRPENPIGSGLMECNIRNIESQNLYPIQFISSSCTTSYTHKNFHGQR